jgi:hypothetical protein
MPEVPHFEPDIEQAASTAEREMYAHEDAYQPYRLTPEQVELLRLEHSDLTPAEAARIEQLGERILDQFRRTYASYMPEEKRAELEQMDGQSIAARVIATDEEGLRLLTEEWLPQFKAPSEHADDTMTTLGFHHQVGDFIWLRNGVLNWASCLKPEFQALLTITPGAGEYVLTLADRQMRTETLAHEIAHHFQDYSLRRYSFVESGASFYGKRIGEQTGGTAMVDNVMTMQLAGIYNDLIQKYGPDVHRLFFGQSIDVKHANQILNACYYRWWWMERRKRFSTALDRITQGLRRVDHSSR